VTRGARSLSRALDVRCFVVYLLSFAVISALVLLEFRLGAEAIEGRSLFARTAEVGTVSGPVRTPVAVTTAP
jgi:hypothetical protein